MSNISPPSVAHDVLVIRYVLLGQTDEMEDGEGKTRVISARCGPGRPYNQPQRHSQGRRRLLVGAETYWICQVQGEWLLSESEDGLVFAAAIAVVDGIQNLLLRPFRRNDTLVRELVGNSGATGAAAATEPAGGQDTAQ